MAATTFTRPDPRRPSFVRRNAPTFGVLAIFVAVAIVALLIGGMVGCKSHTKTIADGAMKAGRESTEIVQHAEAAIVEIDNPPPEVPAEPSVVAWLGGIKSNMLAIVAKGKSINATATTIVSAVPHVEDKVPWWASLLKLFAALGVIALVVYAAVATGAFKVLRGIVWGMGKLIPARALTAAKFDFEYHQKNPDDAMHREAVAANRGKDPAYDAAWQKYKRESESKEPKP
mgnify:CR=1 FL=1